MSCGEHYRSTDLCRWCDLELYDTTCWYCGGRLVSGRGIECGHRNHKVHRSCLRKAQKYLSDTM